MESHEKGRQAPLPAPWRSARRPSHDGMDRKTGNQENQCRRGRLARSAARDKPHEREHRWCEEPRCQCFRSRWPSPAPNPRPTREPAKTRSSCRPVGIRPQAMAPVEPLASLAQRPCSSRQRCVQASRTRTLDCGAPTAHPGPAQPLPGRVSCLAYWHQTLSLHRREFPARRTPSLEQRPEAIAGFARRRARSRCALGNGAFPPRLPR